MMSGTAMAAGIQARASPGTLADGPCSGFVRLRHTIEKATAVSGTIAAMSPSASHDSEWERPLEAPEVVVAPGYGAGSMPRRSPLWKVPEPSSAARSPTPLRDADRRSRAASVAAATATMPMSEPKCHGHFVGERTRSRTAMVSAAPGKFSDESPVPATP